MKRLVLILFALLPVLTAFSQQGVLIGKKEGTPNPYAKLEIYSTNSGLLVPRMTTDERLPINPDGSALSLLVFDTTDSTYFFFNGTEWEKMSANRDIILLTSQMDTLRIRLEESLDSLGTLLIDTMESRLTKSEMVDSLNQMGASGDNNGDVTIVEDNGEGFRETFVWSDTNGDGVADTWVGVTVRPRISGYSVYWFQDDGANTLTSADFTTDKEAATGSDSFTGTGYAIAKPYDGYYVLAFPSVWGRPEFYLNGNAVFDGISKQLVVIDGVQYQAWSLYVRIPSTYTGPDLVLTAVK